MAPGLEVMRIDASKWSIGIRGFGSRLTRSVLVLIDGRTVYTTLFAGTYWEVQDTLIEDVDRIEVIRGPGGTIWGPNAINGVVNIITKTADRTTGGRLETHVGRYEPGNAEFSYGGKLGGTGHYVTRARFIQRGVPGLVQGLENGDDLQAFYARTRVDWMAGTNRFSFQADAEQGDGHQVRSLLVLAPPFRVPTRTANSFGGGTATLSWKRTHSSRVDSSLQIYYSGFVRSQLSETSHTFDVDARQHRALGQRHDVVAGAQYRFTDGKLGPDRTIAITPSELDAHLATAFIQDEVALTDRLHVTAGGKVERNQDTGFEAQPSIRALWNFSPQRSVWGAVSSAVRTPNRFERGMHVLASAVPGPGGLPLVVTLQGSPDTVAEELVDYEAGYRSQHRFYSIDITGFVGAYRDLSSLEPGAPVAAQEMGTRVLRLPLTAANNLEATSKGIEATTTWKPATWWEVSSNYSLERIDFRSRTAQSNSRPPVSGPVPEHQFHVRSFVDLPRGVDTSLLFYRSSSIPDLQVDAFNRLDWQLAWTASERLHLAAGVRNLLHASMSEYTDNTAQAVPTPVRTSPYAEIRWWF
jgi:iron complex outermembrane recepter protein